MTKPIYTGSGGKQPKTPVITNDNLFSKDRVELLLGVGEGPIQGLEDGLKSFYAGDVPLQDNDGNPIIKELVANPHEGLASPTTIVFQLGGESANVSVGVNILQKSPVVRYTPEHFRGKINKLDIRINIAQLFEEDANGNVNNNAAEFRIEYKTAIGGDPWVILDFGNATPTAADFIPPLSNITFGVGSHTDGFNKYILNGKTGSGFIIDFRVAVAEITDDDYMIRVTKFNPDTNNDAAVKTACDIIFDSFQILAQTQRSFTNTALMHVTGRANDQFSDIPDFYGIYKGLITKVPSNRVENAIGAACYDPLVWNGALTTGWHTNPAWVLYDLLDNPRYGMRKYAPTLNIYTQDFYDVGAYCDNAVESSSGGNSEKRYTMNLTLAENQNGWETLQNLAGSFDAVLFDDGEGNVRLKVDRWVEPRVLFTPETVTVEGFNYSFTDVNTQYNSITVSFTNPERGWQETRLKVQDETSINQNGEIPLDFVAVGCTSESEALRRARARLLTATTEKIIISFTTTRLGLILDPLEIVYIADPLLGWGVTGRIEHTRGLEIFLRDPLDIYFNTEADLILQTTTGLFKARVAMTSQRILQVLTNTSNFLNADLPEYAQYTLGNFTTVDGAIFKEAKPFRITAIEPSSDYNSYQLTALEVNRDKYDIVGDANVINITIDKDLYTGLDLKQLAADKSYSLSRQYQSATFTFDGTREQQAGTFLLICGIDVNSYALTVGDWTGILPVDVKPKLVFKGAVKVLGHGGKGGQGGFAYTQTAPFDNEQKVDVYLGYGENGQEGGDSIFWDYPVDIELAVDAEVELLGGYGGGFGGRSLALFSQTLTPPVGSVVNGQSIGGLSKAAVNQGQLVLISGAGGAGGLPLGLGGASGTSYEIGLGAYSGSISAAAGANGDKASAGLALTAQNYTGTLYRIVGDGFTAVNDPYSVYNGEGQDGRPTGVVRNPTPYKVSLNTPPFFATTTAGTPTNGAQGIGVINEGNMNVTSLGAGSVLTYNTASGYNTLTG